MSTLRGSCIVGQSGGPTAVINASAYGVIRSALDNENITNVYGAEHGIRGVLDDKLFDMSKEDPAELALLPYTPSSALGSVRYKLADPETDDTDYQRILEVFKKHDVRYFFYIGGNDSMDTCAKVSRYMKKVGYDCCVLGVPKTIDNDLYGIDHCAALAGTRGCGPDLIYLPEVDFDMDRFLSDVQHVYKETGYCIVAVSEGIHYSDGSFVSEAKTAATDGFGHAQLGGLAATLANIVKERTGAKVRGIELSLLQRCAAHVASATDISEAFALGATAVAAATGGVTGMMVGLKRLPGEKYQVEPELLELDSVANFEKKVPLEWINEDRNGVTQDFIDYCAPLVAGETKAVREGGLPRFAHLKKIYAE